MEASDPCAVPAQKWELKEMSPMHRQVCSLLAQGAKRGEIAAICGITPEYVSMLAAQPLCRAYLREMMRFADARLEAAADQAVDAIIEVLQTGDPDARLKAARLQMEATQRVGAGRSTPDSDEVAGGDNLERLAGRLLGLMARARAVDATIVGPEGTNEGAP